MALFDVYHQYGEELEKKLRLSSLPLAIKLLKNEDDIPEGARRPIKDMGHHLSLCQAFQLTRVKGEMLALMKADMWCYDPVIGLGLAEPPQYYLEGQVPDVVKNAEASKKWIQSAPRFKVGNYEGIVTAPLSTTDFAPDAVMIYCNLFRCRQLLQAVRWEKGEDVNTRLSGHGGTCLYTFIPAIQEGEYRISVPCFADLYEARCGDDQVIFTVPKMKLKSFMSGFRYLAGRGFINPIAHKVRPEYPLPESYMKMGRELGYL